MWVTRSPSFWSATVGWAVGGGEGLAQPRFGAAVGGGVELVQTGTKDWPPGAWPSAERVVFAEDAPAGAGNKGMKGEDMFRAGCPI